MPPEGFLCIAIALSALLTWLAVLIIEESPQQPRKEVKKPYVRGERPSQRGSNYPPQPHCSNHRYHSTSKHQ